MPTPPSLSDQVRSRVKDYDGTRAELCREAGIDPSALSRFMSGERGLSVPDLDKLGQALSLRISTFRFKRRPS